MTQKEKILKALDKIEKYILSLPKETFYKLLEKHKDGDWTKILNSTGVDYFETYRKDLK